MNLHVKIFGREYGNFREPAHLSLGKYGIGLLKVARQVGLNRVRVIRPGFTRHITQFPRSRKQVEFTPPDYGGAIVQGLNTGVAIPPADCPSICIVDLAKRRLALLHGGLRCLISPGMAEPSIVEVVFERHFDPGQIHVWVGGGIGPCCYGHEEVPPEVFGHVDSSIDVRKGPRKGTRAVTLSEIVEKQLRKLGVPKARIKIDRHCTACSGRAGGVANFHSNVYDGPRAGRNLLVAWLEAEPKL